MAIESLVKRVLVQPVEKSGIRWTIRRTTLGSKNPNTGPCSSVSGKKPTLCNCRAPQPLWPSGESKPSHRTKSMSIHEGGPTPTPSSAFSHTMKWYMPTILACQYGNAWRPSTPSSWDRTMMSACVWGLAGSSTLRASYVVDLNRMVLWWYIWLLSITILSCSRVENCCSSPSCGRPLMREYRWSKRRGQKSYTNKCQLTT